MSAVLLVCALPARAATPCGEDDERWIRVTFADTSWSSAKREAMLAQFTAGLAEHATRACFDGGPRPAVAEVTVDTAEPGLANIDILDHTTRKRVIRKADLSAVPEDGQPLALAIAVDDLLQATWAELELQSRTRSEPAPTKPEPGPALPSTPAKRVAPKKPAPISAPTSVPGAPHDKPSWIVGLGAELVYEAEDTAVPGGLLSFQAWPVDDLGLRATFHAGKSLPLDSSLGRVEYLTLGGRLRITYAPIVTRALRVGPFLETAVDGVWFDATPAAGATALDGSGVAVLAGGGAELGWYFSKTWSLAASLGARPALRRVEALAENEVVGGVRSVQLFVELGVGGGW